MHAKQIRYSRMDGMATTMRNQTGCPYNPNRYSDYDSAIDDLDAKLAFPLLLLNEVFVDVCAPTLQNVWEHEPN